MRAYRAPGAKMFMDSHFVIYDDSDQQSLVKQAIKALDLNDKLYRPRAMLSIRRRDGTFADVSTTRNGISVPAELAPETPRNGSTTST